MPVSWWEEYATGPSGRNEKIVFWIHPRGQNFLWKMQKRPWGLKVSLVNFYHCPLDVYFYFKWLFIARCRTKTSNLCCVSCFVNEATSSQPILLWQREHLRENNHFRRGRMKRIKQSSRRMSVNLIEFE